MSKTTVYLPVLLHPGSPQARPIGVVWLKTEIDVPILPVGHSIKFGEEAQMTVALSAPGFIIDILT